jgi:hypothetical protein
MLIFMLMHIPLISQEHSGKTDAVLPVKCVYAHTVYTVHAWLEKPVVITRKIRDRQLFH